MGAVLSLCDWGNHPRSVRIQNHPYSITNCIGEGGYGFVYSAEAPRQSDGGASGSQGLVNGAGADADEGASRHVALKRFLLASGEEQAVREQEVSLHRRLSGHPHIVRYIDHDIATRMGRALPEVWVAMELCEGGSLQDVVAAQMRNGSSLRGREVLAVMLQVCAALRHLHAQSPPVAHWDIKLDNFLVAEASPSRLPAPLRFSAAVSSSAAAKATIKLCDFGSASELFYLPSSAQEVATAEVELDQRMTLHYRAPETLDLWRKERVDLRADLWSVGVLAYVLLFQEMPFDDTKQAVMGAIPKRQESLPVWASEDGAVNIKAALLNIVLGQLLVKDPSKRADIFRLSELLADLAAQAALENKWLPPMSAPTNLAPQKARF